MKCAQIPGFGRVLVHERLDRRNRHRVDGVNFGFDVDRRPIRVLLSHASVASSALVRRNPRGARRGIRGTTARRLGGSSDRPPPLATPGYADRRRWQSRRPTSDLRARRSVRRVRARRSPSRGCRAPAPSGLGRRGCRRGRADRTRPRGNGPPNGWRAAPSCGGNWSSHERRARTGRARPTFAPSCAPRHPGRRGAPC